jgi:cytidylate kinase
MFGSKFIQFKIELRGIDVKIEQLIQEIQERDDRDKHRQIAPMVAASDALVLDTSHLSPDTVFDQALAWINLRLDKTGV